MLKTKFNIHCSWKFFSENRYVFLEKAEPRVESKHEWVEDNAEAALANLNEKFELELGQHVDDIPKSVVVEYLENYVGKPENPLDVRYIQIGLHKIGKNPGEIDGIYRSVDQPIDLKGLTWSEVQLMHQKEKISDTMFAVYKFQREQRFPEDPDDYYWIVGPKTIDRMVLLLKDQYVQWWSEPKKREKIVAKNQQEPKKEEANLARVEEIAVHPTWEEIETTKVESQPQEFKDYMDELMQAFLGTPYNEMECQDFIELPFIDFINLRFPNFPYIAHLRTYFKIINTDYGNDKNAKSKAYDIRNGEVLTSVITWEIALENITLDYLYNYIIGYQRRKNDTFKRITKITTLPKEGAQSVTEKVKTALKQSIQIGEYAILSYSYNPGGHTGFILRKWEDEFIFYNSGTIKDKWYKGVGAENLDWQIAHALKIIRSKWSSRPFFTIGKIDFNPAKNLASLKGAKSIDDNTET